MLLLHRPCSTDPHGLKPILQNDKRCVLCIVERGVTNGLQASASESDMPLRPCPGDPDGLPAAGGTTTSRRLKS